MASAHDRAKARITEIVYAACKAHAGERGHEKGPTVSAATARILAMFEEVAWQVFLPNGDLAFTANDYEAVRPYVEPPSHHDVVPLYALRTQPGEADD